MSRKFLFILTSHEELGSSGKKTGCWLEELAAPYWQFVDAGYEVLLASVAGGRAPVDPESTTDMWLSDDGRRFLADKRVQALMAETVPIDEVEGAGFAGLLLAGGAGAAWDFPASAKIRSLVETFHERGAIVSGICHGVLGLIRAVDGNGEPLIKARRVTCISNAEEAVAGLDKIVPVLPEEAIRKLRAYYLAAPILVENVVQDGVFFTGQNPTSAKPLGKRIIEHLSRSAAG